MTRIRMPFMIPKPCLESYTFEDVLDANTPEDLSRASWNLLLQAMERDPVWAQCPTRTFFVCIRDYIQPERLGIGATRRNPLLRIHARRLRDGRAIRHAWGYMVGGLSPKVAFSIPLMLSVGPVIFADTPGWMAKVVPAVGPSSTLSLLSDSEVTKALGFEFEIEAVDGQAGIIREYGFNLIPEFRRLFELRLEPPNPEIL